MRLRSKKWAGPFISSHQALILTNDQALAHRGKWSSFFGNDHPIYLEIGSGKGQFILNNALAYPGINFIGLELQPTAVAIAGKNAVSKSKKLGNLKLIYGNGADATDYFVQDEIAKIFLNHSDPWPKTKHKKRRLTAPNFLRSYAHILKAGGTLELKTDNFGLFRYSISSFKAFGLSWSTQDISYDLHHELTKQPKNIESEYEQKFAAMGQPEYWVKASFPS